MIRGLGIDLMDVERIQSALERHPRFLTRVYSPAEQEAIRQRGAEAAAGYFAPHAIFPSSRTHWVVPPYGFQAARSSGFTRWALRAS